MGNKKFDLTADLVDASDEKDASLTINKENNNKRVTITFGVSEHFRNEYKIWCTKNNLSMKQALINSFELLKSNH